MSRPVTKENKVAICFEILVLLNFNESENKLNVYLKTTTKINNFLLNLNLDFSMAKLVISAKSNLFIFFRSILSLEKIIFDFTPKLQRKNIFC